MTFKPFKCAACNVPLHGPGDPNPCDVFACPQCGVSDTSENVWREITEYTAERTADFVNRPLREFARRNKNFKFTEHARPKKLYRFVVDLELHR